MITSVTQAVDRIKCHWTCQFTEESINDACRAAGHMWRQRMLPPVLTVRLFLLQILYGNTACSHLPRLSDEEFTPQAYSAARARLPRAALETLLAQTISQLGQAALDTARWLGHRVFLVDGSTFSMPDIDALRALALADLDAPFPTLIVNPERPNSREPRLLKRRPKQFGYLKEPRASYRAKYMAETS